MHTRDTNLAVLGPDLASDIRRPLARRHDPALDDDLGAHRHGPQIRTAQRAADVAAVQVARPRDRQQDRRGQAVEQRRRAPAVQVAGFVAQLGRAGEGPQRALRLGGRRHECGVLQRQRVEADRCAGRRVRDEFVVEDADAVGGREGEVGSLVGLDSGRHFYVRGRAEGQLRG
jgi:hypothetical protein